MRLRADLMTLAQATGANVDVDAIIAAWAEPHRRYHTLEHLTDVLAGIDQLHATAAAAAAAAAARAGRSVDPFAVRWAAYYHDIVYRTDSAGSEEESARRLERDLPAGAMRDEAARMIRMTADHRYSAEDINAAWLSDADLLILAGDSYRRYVDRVRAEFAHVPEDMWRTGRRQVLDGLLATPQLFGLAGAQVERAARANLTAERAALVS